jgi:Hint domain
MPTFSWTNPSGGDWSNAANWGGVIGTPPPGAGDNATFDDLANSYTVTVTGTVGGGADGGPSLSINATSPIRDVALSISGSLKADVLYNTAASGPATSLTIDAGGSLIVPTLMFSFNVLETVTISGMGAGGYLELGDLTAGGFSGGKNPLVILDFANASPTALNTGVIQIDNVNLSSPVTATQQIMDVAPGDAIVIKGANFTGDTVSFDPVTSDLTVKNGATTVFIMNNISLQAGVANKFAIVNGETIQAQIACYARGTMIQTPAGEVAVETMRPGQQVITLIDGVVVPQAVKWVGHRRIDLTRHPRPETVAPIRVERDAFVDNVPHRDLLLSPDHAVFIDGMLICVRQLVNGSTIRRETGWSAVDYCHLELDQHAVVLAEGFTVESYLDTGNRAFFANSGAPLVLHPDLPNENRVPTRAADSCAPFVSDDASVRPVWQGVADRAAAIGRAAPVRVTTTDADPRLQCPDGRIIMPLLRDNDRVIFALPGVASEVRLVSRAQAPGEVRPWLSDPRRLGTRVKRIVQRGAGETREIPMDHPDFARGWWEIEHDGPGMSRWTDGAAVLPLPLRRGPVLLEIHFAGAMTFVNVEDAEAGTERRAA